MMTNLLQNWSLEGITRPGGYTHVTYTGEIHGNFVTPEAFVGWWDERGDRCRPETEMIARVPPYIGPPARIYDGDWAVKMFVSFHAWMGGYYQIVNGLEAGRRYRTGYMAHAWCNQDGLPHAGDPNCAPIGCGTIWCLEEFLPPLNGDPVNDAWWAALFQVGVQHLAAGQSPDPAYNVIWAPAAAIYNDYHPVPPLAFVAQSKRVAVFIRANLRWGFRNNDAYLDAMFLHLDDELPPARTYGRTYVLLPNNDPFDAVEQQRITKLNPGVSIGPSADDAAIGHPNLIKTTVISYKPQTWGGKDALEAFWRKYYNFPRLQDSIMYREDDEPNPYLLWQRDPEWKDIGFGSATCYDTIGESGCFITCLAMAQRFYNIQDDATPPSVDEALGYAGYNGCVANWRGNNAQFEDQLRISISDGTTTQALAHIDAGGCAMAEVIEGPGQHFVLAIEVEATNDGPLVRAVDPWLNEDAWMLATDAESWRILTLVEPPVTDTAGRIGAHLQQEIGDWRGLSAVTTPMKFLAGIQNITTVKQINPNSFPVWRQHVEHQGLYLENPNHDAGANQYLDTFRDSLEEVLEEIARTMPGLESPWFGVESLNETYAHGDPKVVTQSIPFDRAWIRALARYPEVSPVVYCAAVGNIELPRDVPGSQAWKDLVGLAKAGEAQHAAWGYHGYWIANPQESLLVSHWDYLAGRWTLFDEYLVGHGARVNWFFGETGAIGGHFDGSAYHFLPNDGWKSGHCYAGNWPRYEQDLLLFNGMVQEWNTTHGGRASGGTIFTTGGGEKWKTFEIGPAEIERLKTVLS